MPSQPLEIEGTWEEIAAHAAQLAGRKVRLTVLAQSNQRAVQGKLPGEEPFWENRDSFSSQHVQPVENLEKLLASLPDFGDEAADLWRVICENRAWRREWTPATEQHEW